MALSFFNGGRMKIYTTKTERKVMSLERENERLREENECLKEQLLYCDMDKVTEQMRNIDALRAELQNELREVDKFKEKYRELIRDLRNEKERKLKKVR